MQTDDAPEPDRATAGATTAVDGPTWERLPAAAHPAYLVSSVLGFGVPATVAALVLGFGFHAHITPLALLPAGWLLVLVLAAVHGSIRFRRTRFVLDDTGLRIRRGLCWRSETLVPRSRVQHLDLEHGPIERALGLATLVVHTAGTRLNAVRLAGVGTARGRAIRDELINRESDDDDAV